MMTNAERVAKLHETARLREEALLTLSEVVEDERGDGAVGAPISDLREAVDSIAVARRAARAYRLTVEARR